MNIRVFKKKLFMSILNLDLYYFSYIIIMSVLIYIITNFDISYTLYYNYIKNEIKIYKVRKFSIHK